MIQDLFDVTVNRGYLCFTRSNDHIEEVWFSKKDFEESRQVVRDILEIIETGEFPKRASNASRCVDCCYRNICA